MFDEKMRMEADTMSYVQEQEAGSNQLLLTPEYIQLQLAKSLANNTKMYFSGDASLIGGLLNQVYDKDVLAAKAG